MKRRLRLVTLLCALAAVGVLATVFRPQAEEVSESEPPSVSESDLQLYIKVYAAMQDDHDLMIENAIKPSQMSLDDFRILCYGAGRAMLWLVVFFALWSMYDYFTKFYGKVRDRIQVRERRRSRILRRRKRKTPAAVLGSTRGE